MSFDPEKKKSLLIPSGPNEGKHLFVILTNRDSAGFHLLVSLSSVRPNRYHDPTTIIEAGEHEFVRNASFVYYRKPEQLLGSSIVVKVAAGVLVVKSDFSDELFDRVCAGIDKSEMSPKWAVAYFRANRDR